jgi:hypothetical protein
MSGYNNNRVAHSLQDVKVLEAFLFALMPLLAQQELYDGEDVLAFARERGMRVPNFLEGEVMLWQGGGTAEADEAEGEALVFVRAGDVTAVGLTIGCIKWRRFRVCLECGWLYCRIVIKGVFATG